MIIDTASKTVPESPQEFLVKYKPQIKKFFTDQIDTPNRAARMAQLCKVRKAECYWEGLQYGNLTYRDGGFEWTALDTGKVDPNKQLFQNVYNIVFSDGQKFKAMVGQRRLNQMCLAENPDDVVAADEVREAQAMAKFLFTKWKLQRRTADEIAQPLWTSGSVFSFVQFIVNGVEHGYHSEAVYKMETVQAPGEHACPACGGSSPEGSMQCQYCASPLDPSTLIPGPQYQQSVQSGTQSYAKGMVELDLLTSLQVMVPNLATDIDKRCGWLDYSFMVSKNRGRAIMERLMGSIESMLPGSDVDEPVQEAERIMEELRGKDGAGGEEKDTVYSRRWVNPVFYDEMPRPMRRAFEEKFPKGHLVHRLGGIPMSIEESEMEYCWAVCKSGTNKYINSPGLSWPILPQQDSLNNHYNLIDETVMRGLPMTLVDGSIISKDRSKDPARVAELIFTKPGMDLSKVTRTIEPAKMQEASMMVPGQIREFSRELDGVAQSIWGGGDPAPTWRQDQQQKAGAMQVLQLPFENEQEFVSNTLRNGVRMAGKWGVGMVTAPPVRFGEVPTNINLAKIPQDGWTIQSVESSPQTMAEQKSTVASISQEAPELAAAIGITHPINAGKIQALFGIDGMYTPGEYERERILREVEQLLSEPPMSTVDPMTGQMIQKCSIPVDQFLDKPFMQTAEMFRVWCTSPAGGAASRDPSKNFANVVLRGTELEQAGQMEAMAAQAPPGPAAPAPAP